MSCSNEVRDTISEVISVENFSNLQQEEWFEIKSFVPLSSSGCSDYLFSVGKLLDTKQGIYILDFKDLNRKIFRFDGEGKCIQSINGSMDGKKTFNSISDIDYYQNRIWLTDKYADELLEYDVNLSYVQSISSGYDVGLENIHFFSNGSVVSRPVLEGEMSNALVFGDLNSTGLKVSNNYGGKGADNILRTLSYAAYRNFHLTPDPGRILYTEYFDDVIIELSSKGVQNKIEVDISDDYWMSDEDIASMKGMTLAELIEVRNRLNKGFYFDVVGETNNHLVISYLVKGRRFFITKEKNSGKVKSGQINFNSRGILSKEGLPNLNYLANVSPDGSLIFILPAEEFIAASKELQGRDNSGLIVVQQSFLSMADNIDEYCSYVLVYAELK